MGNEESSPTQLKLVDGVDPSEEMFFHNFLLEEQDFNENLFTKNNKFNVSPQELMQIIMTNSSVLENKEEALQYLIEYSIDQQDSKDKKQLLIQMIIDKKRFQMSKELASFRLCEKPIKNNNLSVGSDDSIIFDSISILLQAYNEIPINNNDCVNLLNEILNINMGANLIPPRKEYEYKQNCFTGLLPSSNILPHGLSCNGQFLYALDGNYSLYIFPLLDNGALLPPWSKSINILADNAELTVYPSTVVIHSVKDYAELLRLFGEMLNSRFFNYLGKKPKNLALDTIFHENDLLITNPDIEVKAHNKIGSTGVLNVSDGVVHVVLNKEFEASVFLGEYKHQELVSKCVLHEGKIKLDENSPPLLSQNLLFMSPCETNGVFLTFYIKIDETHYIARQFSLLTGEHVAEEIIETNGPIIAICLDIIHNIHWVVTNNANNIVIKAYHYTGVVDPYTFQLKTPRFEEKISNIQKLINLLNLNLFCSIGPNVPPKLLLRTPDEFQALLSNILNMIQNYNQNAKPNKQKLFMDILQIFVIVAAMNAQLFRDNQKIITQIQYLLKEIPKLFHNSETINIVSLLLSFTLDSVMNIELIPLLVAVVNASKYQLRSRIMSDIANSTFLSKISSIDSQNSLSKLLMKKTRVDELDNVSYSLLAIQQRVLVREAYKELFKDEFSSIRIYKSQVKSKTSLDYLSEYTQILVNQFATELASMKSINDLMLSTTYNLYTNFIFLIWGISDNHAIAQIVLPLISVLPPLIYSFSSQFTKDQQANLNSYLNYDFAFTFGILVSTLIKGGKYSEFESRNKWLIGPNMSLADSEDILNNSMNTLNDNSLIPEEKMMDLYKIWKPAINKKLKDDVKFLDRIIMSVYVKILPDIINVEINNSIANKKLNDNLRQFLDNMLRVRNAYIKAQREGNSHLTEIIMSKSRMLLNLEEDFSYFQTKTNQKQIMLNSICSSENYVVSSFDVTPLEPIVSKNIADFICSQDTPESIIHFISNQKVRINLTSIGFSLLYNIYTQNIPDPNFYKILATALTSIENFDNLASILSLNDINENSIDEKKKTQRSFIFNFLKLAIDKNDNLLLLVAYRMMKSGAINKTEIGNFLLPIFNTLMQDTTNYSYFSFCANFISYIPGALDKLYSMLPASPDL